MRHGALVLVMKVAMRHHAFIVQYTTQYSDRAVYEKWLS